MNEQLKGLEFDDELTQIQQEDQETQDINYLKN